MALLPGTMYRYWGSDLTNEEIHLKEIEREEADIKETLEAIEKMKNSNELKSRKEYEICRLNTLLKIFRNNLKTLKNEN